MKNSSTTSDRHVTTTTMFLLHCFASLLSPLSLFAALCFFFLYASIGSIAHTEAKKTHAISTNVLPPSGLDEYLREISKRKIVPSYELKVEKELEREKNITPSSTFLFPFECSMCIFFLAQHFTYVERCECKIKGRSNNIKKQSGYKK